MAYTISQNLNIKPKYFAPVVVHLSAGDSGIPITFSMYDGAYTYEIPSGAVISVQGTRRDGASWITTGTASGNEITFTSPSAMAAVEGAGIGEISITSGSETYGSANFLVLVERASIPNGVSYSNDPSVFQDILNYVKSGIALGMEEATSGAVAEWLEENITPTTPVVDESLSVSGAAADAKVTGDFKNIVNMNLPNIHSEFSITGSRIIADGSISPDGTSVNQSRTDYIPCGEGCAVFYHGMSFIYQGNAVMLCLAFYDASKRFISGIAKVGNETASTTGDIKTFAPTGTAYVIASTNNGVDNPYLKIYSLPEELANLDNHIHKPEVTFIDGVGVAYDNGVLVNDTTYSYCEINVALYSGGTIKGYSGASDNRGIAFFDEQGNYISGFGNPRTGTYNWVVNGSIPNNAYLAKIHCKSTYKDSFYIDLYSENVFGKIADYIDEIEVGRKQRNDEIIHKTKNARHVKRNGYPKYLTFLHLSDIHADIKPYNRILADAEQFGSVIDEMICTGDMVGDGYGEIESWWNPNMLTVIGNHDTALYSDGTYDWTALSMADRDAYYIAPFEENWGIVHTSGTSYYYKDYTEQNVRLIVMDAMLYSSYEDDETLAAAQNTWLYQLLISAISSGFHVVIAIHSPHDGSSPVDCSFTKKNETAMPLYSDCNTPQSVIDIVAEAITNGLHFIGYLCGHTHQDNIWSAGQSTHGNGTQLMYCVTCAAMSYAPQWQNSDQDRSNERDAYNIVTIDTTNTLVKIVRGGGADMDDHMRTRKAICFNYSTGEMVGEVL